MSLKGPYHGPVLFSIIKHIDSGTEGTLNNFANGSKLSGVVYVLEGRDDIQRELYRLEGQTS